MVAVVGDTIILCIAVFVYLSVGSWRIAVPTPQCFSTVSSGPASKYVPGLIIRPASLG